METFKLDKPVHVLCVTATSFPAGIGEAWNKLRKFFPPEEKRTYYGISFGDGKEGVIYKAAAEERLEGEAEQLDCERFTVKEGSYIGTVIKDWKKDETIIGRTFQQLLEDPRIDKDNGYCVEIYLNEQDVQCMVKAKD